MRCVVMSDLHGQLPFGEIPKCDVVLIAGDIMPAINHSFSVQDYFLKHVFSPWCESLPCKRVFFIAGNHDFALRGLSKGYI